jgi:hypothetical protein
MVMPATKRELSLPPIRERSMKLRRLRFLERAIKPERRRDIFYSPPEVAGSALKVGKTIVSY